MLGAIPIAKLIYTLLLLILIGVLTREAFAVRFDQRVYVGAFDVASASGADSKTFALQSSAASACSQTNLPSIKESAKRILQRT